MAVLAGQLRVNITLFVTTCLVGRYIRFLVILGAADWFIHLF
jgi:membrane protein YqaA with SNARE-associated domain